MRHRGPGHPGSSPDPYDGSPEAETEGWRATLPAVLGRPFLPGNRVTVFQNGVRIFPALLAAIASARQTIELETYLFEDGTVARSFAEALAQAAGRGVLVRIVLDAVGSMRSADAVARMLEAGVEVRWFRPVSRWRVWRRATVDNRTHRRILVVDDEVSFLGGVGIADEWEGDARGPQEWRETHFEIRGPAVASLHAAFLGHWIECGPLDADLLRPVRPVPAGDSEILVLPTVGIEARSGPSLLYHALTRHARRRVRITTPYFVPDGSTAESILACAARGVEVELLLPGPHTDHRVCNIAGTPTLRTLHESGVRIWRYQPTFIHTKAITVDGVLSVVGSANLNHRSLVKDDEALAIVLDAALTAELDRAFDSDVASSLPATGETLLDPGPVRRLVEWVVRRGRRQL
ncbi:MAG TPA: phospholipase D-like domain-containing protein [Longimicrobiales bacterium]|nr:phospholipase D-like domain-containing protein [Longimicrobiales bacterium]